MIATDPSDTTPDDQARIMLLTYLTIRQQIDTIDPNNLAVVQAAASGMGKAMTSLVMIAEANPEVCAAIQDLATAELLSCPDFCKYAIPCMLLQKMAVIGRIWFQDNNPSDEKIDELVKFSERAVAFMEEAEEAMKNNTHQQKIENEWFSDAFVAGVTASAKERNLESVSNLFSNNMSEDWN